MKRERTAPYCYEWVTEGRYASVRKETGEFFWHRTRDVIAVAHWHEMTFWGSRKKWVVGMNSAWHTNPETSGGYVSEFGYVAQFDTLAEATEWIEHGGSYECCQEEKS